MPARNILKSYVEGGFYHIYNRGVEKRDIFTSKLDSSVFLGYLKEYLLPKEMDKWLMILVDESSDYNSRAEAIRHIRMNNFAEEIELHAYCLMPNHFHLLIKQNSEKSIEKFMRSVCTRYVQYFNRAHKRRVGNLFQATYKAVLVESDSQLIHLSRYIHRNPYGSIHKGETLIESTVPSSYLNYLGKVKQEWLKTEIILGYFSKSGFNSYQSFVEGTGYHEESLRQIENVVIDIEENP